MSILEALLTGLAEATSLQVLPYLFGGAVFGLFLGVIPGLGGHFAMAMVIPLLYALSPAAGIAFLLGAHSTVAQGGGLTAILFNTPGCGQNAATLLDGPAMRTRGLAGKAAGAALASCFLGALFGVVVLALLIPVLQQLVLVFGPAEISMLVFLALTFVIVLGKENIPRGMIAGLAGLLLAMVGLDNISNQERFTFGLLGLRDGLPLVPVILGLFAVAEMMDLWVKGESMSGKHVRRLSAKEMQKQIFQGVASAFKHWWLVMRCSAIGTAMGLIPGLGSTAAAFVAYGHARQTSKSAESFGSGNIEGIIGPESANDAVEGGALASTIAFGIPGSSSMAIVLAGLFVLGLQTGPEMVTQNTDLVFVMIFTVIIGNFFGTVVGMFLVNPLSRLTTLPATLMVPVLISVIFTGAYAINQSIFDIGIVVVFGFVGYMMKHLQYSRSALLIGLVLGAVLEKNLFLAIQLEDSLFFLNPAPLAILLFTAVFLSINIRSIARRKTTDHSEKNPGYTNSSLDLGFILIAGICFITMLIKSFDFQSTSARTPIFILIPLLILTGIQISRTRNTLVSGLPHTGKAVTRRKHNREVNFAGWITILFLLIAVFGHYPGIAVFMLMLLSKTPRKDPLLWVAITSSVTLGLYTLFEFVFEIELYRGIIYRALAGYQLL